MDKIKMLNNNVLIQLKTENNVTDSGIVLPSNTQNSYNMAVVVSIPEQDFVNVGDTVYIPRYAGSEIKIENETYFIINIKDIILIS